MQWPRSGPVWQIAPPGVIECSTEVPGRPRADRQGPIV